MQHTQRGRPGKTIPLFVIMCRPCAAWPASWSIPACCWPPIGRRRTPPIRRHGGAHRLLRGDSDATAKSEATTFVTSTISLPNATVTRDILSQWNNSLDATAKYVEVIVTNSVKTAFLGAWGFRDTVSARAVAEWNP